MTTTTWGPPLHDLALPSTADVDAGGGPALLGLSLCAGTGGLDLGLALAEPGYRAVGYVERDAFAAAVLVARMEDQTLDQAPVWDDLAGFDGRQWCGAVDLVRRATRASRSASPASARARTIRAISGRTSPGSSRSADLFGCSSRTFPIISTSVIARSEKSWKTWATALRKDCSRRLKSAHRTAGSGSSYSRGAYPTPSATPYGSSQNEGKVPHDRPSRGTPSLETWAKTWPTPRACSGKRSSGGNRHQLTRAWRTPTDDSRRGGAQAPEKRLAGNHTVNLADQALGWPTPNVPNGGRVNPPGTSATRQVPDGSKKQIGLDEVARASARRWMTPTTRDHKDGATTLANTPVNALLGRQVLKIGTAGSDSSAARRTLNPLFVETLMGWPAGWAGFGSAATAWSRWLPRMRGELSRLGSDEARPEVSKVKTDINCL